MENNYFYVHNGLLVGPLSIDAPSGSILTTGTITATNLVISNTATINGAVILTTATVNQYASQTSFSAGTTGLTPSGASTGAITLAGTLITSNGGTGLSSWTAGQMPYYATGTALSQLSIGTARQVMTVNSGATAPQWTTLSIGGGTF
jgi:hypothetical protein